MEVVLGSHGGAATFPTMFDFDVPEELELMNFPDKHFLGLFGNRFNCAAFHDEVRLRERGLPE